MKMVSAIGQEGKTQMANDLINRQQAIDAVMELIEAGIEWRSGISRKISLLNAVYCALEDIPSAQPTVDAVPVIRCKDCRWWVKDKRMGNIGRCFGREHQWAMHSDGFCSDAERRTDEID